VTASLEIETPLPCIMAKAGRSDLGPGSSRATSWTSEVVAWRQKKLIGVDCMSDLGNRFPGHAIMILEVGRGALCHQPVCDHLEGLLIGDLDGRDHP
jgi:hypothetical protein